MVADSVSSLPTMPGDRETVGAPAVRSGRSETVTEPQLNACDTPAEVTVIVPVFVPEVVYDLVTLIPVPSRLFGLPVALGPPLQEYVYERLPPVAVVCVQVNVSPTYPEVGETEQVAERGGYVSMTLTGDEGVADQLP